MPRQTSRRSQQPSENHCTNCIPGSFDWLLEQRLRSPIIPKNTESYWSSLTGDEQMKLTQILRDMKGPSARIRKNTDLIRDITQWTIGNNWMMVEGGEHDGKWVNPRYPSEIFESGRLPDLSNNNYTYFPLANSLTDPVGIACHFEINAGGTQCYARPNKWTEAATLRYHRRARQHASRRKHKQYLRRQGYDNLAKSTKSADFIARTVKKMKERHQ